MKRLALVVALGTACSGTSGSDAVPTITAVTPPFGPLAGGTHIVLTGSGFLHGGAAPDHVLVGNHEAPLAGAIDDSTLEVDLPAGDAAGDVDITVFNHNGTGTGSGLFHYSALPTISSVTPANVLSTVDSTKMTISGTGFQDEDAGFLQVLLDGMPAVDVVVMSDTQITFTALAGPALTRPDLQVVNTRGAGDKPSAFRYVPSTRSGLLLFPLNDPNTFFYFFDPVDQSVISIPQKNPNPMGARAIIIDPDGDYAAMLRDTRYGKIDFRTQDLALNPVTTNNQLPEIIGTGNGVFAVARGGPQFGKFDPSNGEFTPIGNANLVCCGSIGLAVDPTGAGFITTTPGIATLNLLTGAVGSTVAFSPAIHIHDIRFVGPTLYAIIRNSTNTNNSDLVTLNPLTGASAIVKSFTGRITAMEVFQ